MITNQTENIKYYLNIFHRDIDVKIKDDETIAQAKSHGHLFLTLQAGSQHDYFGKYPEGNIIYGKGEIKTKGEEVTHEMLIEFAKQTGDLHFFQKKINLSEEEYKKALKYSNDVVANSKLGENQYILGFADCIDFVQSVYNAAGLPLYFTSAYSRQELKSLDTLASSKMSIKYGSRDTIKQHLNITEGVSREQIAKDLNISIDKIRPSSPVIDLSLQAYDTLLPKFKIKLEDSDLLDSKKISINIVDAAKISLSGSKLVVKMVGLQLNETDKESRIKLLEDKTKMFFDNHIKKLQYVGDKYRSESSIGSQVNNIIESSIEKFTIVNKTQLDKVKESIEKGEVVDINKIIISLFLNCLSHVNFVEDGLSKLNQKLESDTQALQETLMMLVLKEKNKQVENQNKYNKLVEKVKASLEEYENKANNIFKNFVEAKSDSLRKNGENLTNQANAEIQQIAASIDTKNAALHAQKQAELDMIPPVRIQTGPNSYLDTNEAARNQKQAEYENLLAQYKSQCESQIANIKAKYESQANQQKQSVESDISNKATAFKKQKENYAKEVLSKLDEIKAKLSKGEDVDIDNIINEIDISTSVSLSNIQHSVNQGNMVVYALSDVIYDNPILNHPELIKHMAAKFGSGIIDKLISFGMQFTSSEDKSLLDNICDEPNSLETFSLLMGLDTVDSITYN